MKIAVIGSGISGISAAAYSGKAGHEVHVFEKNATIGGRARQFTTSSGYTFDMGPSWYWMPDIINNFFQDFGCESSDFYDLVPLNPQFEMIFPDESLEIPKEYQELRNLFELIEKGAAKKLDAFMKSARYKYELGMKEFVHKPCYTWWEFVTPKTATQLFKLNLLSNFRSYVKRYFSHPKLVALMEFPVLFLGGSPKRIPALYSLMNYGAYGLGTWYPKGGFYQLVLAMKKIADRQGVHFHCEQTVEHIRTLDDRVHSLIVQGEEHFFDAVISSCDYPHTESLLEPSQRNYSPLYWENKTFAPSCLIYYLGFKTRIPRLRHHNLFFENDLDLHMDDIYFYKQWPQKPLFYACCPSKTDTGVAPENHENLFLLMPIAIGLKDTEETRERYFLEMIERIQKHAGCSHLLEEIDYKKSYCLHDFELDYNAYKGNAYGLANTFRQTAVSKPSIRNKKLVNLYYTGQFTVPGPGVPPSIISGKIVAEQVNKLKKARYESAI